MILFSSHSERKKMEKEREENTYSQGHEKEKDLASSFDETRSKTMRFYFEQNDKRFCLNVSNLVLLKQKVLNYFLLLIAA